tara:strand:- start:547 stop:804 length:258 start_codon:yes stop_codon:yes gene_type:complete
MAMTRKNARAPIVFVRNQVASQNRKNRATVYTLMERYGIPITPENTITKGGSFHTLENGTHVKIRKTDYDYDVKHGILRIKTPQK